MIVYFISLLLTITIENDTIESKGDIYMKLNVYIERNGFNSKGIYDTGDDSILVLKDSVVSSDLKSHFIGSSYYTLRKNLENEGIIKNSRFTKDYFFSKTSPASSVILGSITNGKREWINENGLDLNSLNARGLTQINKRLNLISDLLKACDKEAEMLSKEIENKIIETASKKTDDFDSLFKEIILLRTEKDEIQENKHTLEFIVKVVEKLWIEYNKNN